MKPSGYLTSSKIVKDIIIEFGIDIFEIRRIKTFDNGEQAYDYETAFLNKVNAMNNPKFYNLHNNLNVFKSRKTTIDKLGVEYPFQSKDILKKASETRISRYGVCNPALSHKDKIKDTMISLYGVDNYFKTGLQNIAYTKLTGYSCPMADPAIKKRVSSIRKAKSLREEVVLIKRYVKCFNISLTRGWYQFSDKKLNILLDEIQQQYGDLDALTYKENAIKDNKGNRISQRIKSGREIVKRVKNYFGNKKVPFGRGWHMKSDDDIEEMLKKYKENLNENVR